MQNRRTDTSLHVELLEPRRVLSLIFAIGEDMSALGAETVDVGELKVSEHHRPGHGGSGPPGGNGPAIDLPTVAAHEFGHSLGLPHISHPDCGSAGQPLMCAFYIGESFQLHQADIDAINAIYPSGGGNGTWNSSVDITYSFTPDRSRMDSGGRSSLFETMNDAFGSEAVWKAIFVDALDLWAAVEPSLSFAEVPDDGSPFNANGLTQGDPDFGDIRISAHKFDGAAGTLAHAYFPPPNGATAAGDAHFDSAENWQDLRGAPWTLPINLDIHGDAIQLSNQGSVTALGLSLAADAANELRQVSPVMVSTPSDVPVPAALPDSQTEFIETDEFSIESSILESRDILDRNSVESDNADVLKIEPLNVSEDLERF